MAFTGVHVHYLILFGQWEAPAGDGGRRECDIRALPSWVFSRGAVVTAVSTTPKPGLRFSLLLGSGISPSVYGFGPRVQALGCYKLRAPELFLVVS